MKTVLRILFLVFFILSANLWAAESTPSWYTLSADKKATLNVVLFLTSTCPHCQKADAFFSDLATKSTDLNIQRNIINEDKEALIRFNQFLNDQHMDDFVVPSIFFCNSRWVGFATPETTGKDLLHAIDYCKQQIEKDGTLTPATVNTLRQWANANKFDSGMVQHSSFLQYIITIALTDAFSPCSFFCFMGFLGFLFIGNETEKKIVAGALFIIAIIAMHYFQQAHTSIFYHILFWLRLPTLLLGLAVLYYVVQHYKQQYSTLWYYSLAFFVGLMTTAYQQTCAMNWAYIFQQWLGNQHISSVQSGFYQALYQAIYALPIILMLVIYAGLLKIKRFAVWQSRWVSTGLLFLLAIALCFIAYPMLLSYLGVSVFALILLLICGYFLKLP
jgi:glutaredoxin